MTVGDREFAEVMARLDALAKAIDAALPHLVRDDVFALKFDALSQRVGQLAADVSAASASRNQLRVAMVSSGMALVGTMVTAVVALVAVFAK